MSHIKITSKGTCHDTEVTVDGKRVSGVTKIEIEPIDAKSGMLKAIIGFELITLDIDIAEFSIEADDVFMNEKIRSALLDE